ncbi:uncharacterized protein PHALS_09158 [Plasmopara halstedii]|uniref:Uncharacterized protein n=1 Tax=Plasmopara halstedii TaxID=4781 RepID=A0A0N7L4M6_PLAHL|nr:uncharacterized protein PHALS_09158 [Plasmopara halstedii]CEG39099.1 hypothetical protein PHALS_09158 [Plasmopara halstedii]|eukprot:XP_024575468.1 hypothetical protein PHALS_09158 [Plasmopara halstedii]
MTPFHENVCAPLLIGLCHSSSDQCLSWPFIALATAEHAAMIKNTNSSYNHVRISAENRNLKGIEKDTPDEERSFPGSNQMRRYFDAVAQNKDVQHVLNTIKRAFKKDTRHASVSMLIGLAKMLTFVGIIAGTTGYFVYRVSNS